MFLVGRIINLVDGVRPTTLFSAGTLRDHSLAYSDERVSAWIRTHLVRLGGWFRNFGWLRSVPLSTISFATLPRSVLTQATALFSLVRNIGSSIGIAIL